MSSITVTEALSSPKLFQPFFTGPSWATWRAVLKASLAEPLSDSERGAFAAVAGRQPPEMPVRELVCAVGRGGGKDSVASLLVSLAAVNFNPKG